MIRQKPSRVDEKKSTKQISFQNTIHCEIVLSRLLLGHQSEIELPRGYKILRICNVELIMNYISLVSDKIQAVDNGQNKGNKPR